MLSRGERGKPEQAKKKLRKVNKKTTELSNEEFLKLSGDIIKYMIW